MCVVCGEQRDVCLSLVSSRSGSDKHGGEREWRIPLALFINHSFVFVCRFRLLTA